jgi:hypothetical protein
MHSEPFTEVFISDHGKIPKEELSPLKSPKVTKEKTDLRNSLCSLEEVFSVDNWGAFSQFRRAVS